jgi:1-acyl-sn-glycerol-3-phosphate acyltransferase
MASVSDRLEVLARGAACILAAVPVAVFIPLPLTMALTRRFHREDLVRRLHLMTQWARFCREHILGIRLDVEGRQHLPSPSRGHMYVSNHQSWVDILVLMDAMETVGFLSKTLVKYIPVLGRCAYAGGTVYVARDDASSRQTALLETLRMCQESVAVVIFPEGTRSPDGELRRKIHTGSLRAAHHHRLRVVPVGIDGTIKVVPKTMDRVNTGQHVAVTIGEPLDPAGFTDATAWADEIWRRVIELHRQSRARLERRALGV